MIRGPASMQPPAKILVTCALPYANGQLHLGHMVGYIQADIWVRAQKMQGIECLFVCGSDSHGTPIMIQAEKLGITPEVLIKKMCEDHEKDFADFYIGVDNYYTTHSPENKDLVETIFKRHLAAGNIAKRVIKQLYDPTKAIFLPDRYIKGECPFCGAQDQYGDSCEVCGKTYAPTDLKNPYSTLSGAKPIEKDSEHYFFKLQNFQTFLQSWTQHGHLQTQVSNKLDEWFQEGLREWDISRDAPYFGFLIPGETEKYFYVWLDAPVGYMASFKNLCEQRPDLSFDEYWDKNSSAELYHFIGKDIIYFHALFWPAILKGADFRTPTGVFANGFLTIDGQKMSKSRGTFIRARTYLEHFDPEFLRYYFAAKLNDRIEDLDINFDDFMQRINADLIGKFINIASRCASFLELHFDKKLSENLLDPMLYQDFVELGDTIAEKYQKREFSQAIRLIMQLADKANQYIDEKKPWVLIKDPHHKSLVQDVCTMGINFFRLLLIYLKPILPVTAERAESFLNVDPLTWHDKDKPLLDHSLRDFEPLMQRIDPNQIKSIKMTIQNEAEKNNVVKADDTTIDQTISVDDFAKIDLRIAKIIEADHVEGADKLIKLTVDLGAEQPKQIFAGIKSSYQPEELLGRHVVVIANLAPRKMRFGTSHGMMVVAKDEVTGEVFLVSPDPGAKAGSKVK